MRRISRCVTGVPLPGWMFSAFMTTSSLPSMSSTLPLRTALAITSTTAGLSRLSAGAEPSHHAGGRQARQIEVGAFYKPFCASPRRKPRQKKPRRNRRYAPLPDPKETSPWWCADRHRDRRPFLAARVRILKAVRGWFEAQGFTEVETAALQVSPGNETHLHAFATELIDPGGVRRPLYLHTS